MLENECSMTGVRMRRRNWWVILPLSALLGYFGFRFWGALAGPLLTVVVLAVMDNRRRNHLDVENARLATFLESQAPGTLPKPAGAASPAIAAASAFAVPQPTPTQSAAADFVPGLTRPVKPALPAPSVPVTRTETLERTVALALRGNDPALAVALMREWQDVPSTPFAPTELARLWEVALGIGEFFVAGCLAESTAARLGDSVSAQKALLEFAARAASAGIPQMARRLYERLIKAHPTSPFVSFARASMERLE